MALFHQKIDKILNQQNEIDEKNKDFLIKLQSFSKNTKSKKGQHFADIVKLKKQQVKEQNQFKQQVLDNMSLILKKNPKKRNCNDISYLQTQLSQIKFFQEQIEKHGITIYDQLCKFIQYKFVKKGQVVFEQDSIGHNFYIILKGNVGIYIKTQNANFQQKWEEFVKENGIDFLSTQLTEKQAKEEYLYWDLDNILDEIIADISEEEKLKEQQKIAKIFKVDISQVPRLSQVYQFNQMFKRKSRIFQQLLKQPSKKQFLVPMYNLQFIKQLQAGDSFGEMALINDAPRRATIIAAEDCHFGILNKENFISIIQSKEDLIMQKRISWLLEVQPFSFLQYKTVCKLFLFLKEEKYIKGNYVYNQGDKPDKMYIIIDGEFQIQKNVPILNEQERSIYDKINQKFYNGAKGQKYQRLNLALLDEKGQFGFIEILNNSKKRIYSVVCNSAHGRLYSISQTDVLSQFFSESNVYFFYEKSIRQIKLLYKKKIQEIQIAANNQKEFRFQTNFVKKDYSMQQNRINYEQVLSDRKLNVQFSKFKSFFPSENLQLNKKTMAQNYSNLNIQSLEQIPQIQIFDHSTIKNQENNTITTIKSNILQIQDQNQQESLEFGKQISVKKRQSKDSILQVNDQNNSIEYINIKNFPKFYTPRIINSQQKSTIAKGKSTKASLMQLLTHTFEANQNNIQQLQSQTFRKQKDFNQESEINTTISINQKNYLIDDQSKLKSQKFLQNIEKNQSRISLALQNQIAQIFQIKKENFLFYSKIKLEKQKEIVNRNRLWNLNLSKKSNYRCIVKLRGLNKIQNNLQKFGKRHENFNLKVIRKNAQHNFLLDKNFELLKNQTNKQINEILKDKQ